ncbi:AAA family ATPase [Vagococcus carniphilus]|uniref:AAA family ATPase n=1 Tax=Vagococcus carniphilus TaxID=218144 RepID=UPI003B5D0465
MLAKFSVHNFKNFNEELSVDLTNISDYQFNSYCIKNSLINKGILYGPNATGKSNLIQAIFDVKNSLFGNPVNINPDNDESNYLNYNNLNVTKADFFYEFHFDNDIIQYAYGKKDSTTFVYEKFSINNECVFCYDHSKNEYNIDGFKNNKYLNEIQFHLWEKNENMPLLRFMINNSNYTSTPSIDKLKNFITKMAWLRPSDSRAIGNLPIISSGGKNIRILTSIIEKDKISELQDFLLESGNISLNLVVKESIEGDKEIYVKFENGKLLKLNRVASGGTWSLIAIFFMIMNLDDTSLLLIDEFDANYHHLTSENVIKKIISESDHQILVTTHNTDIMTNKLFRPDSIFLLDNNKFIPVKDATTRELREGHNLEKLYQNGDFING